MSRKPKSKIVSLERFNTQAAQPADFIVGTFDSDVTILNKNPKRLRKESKWILKSPPQQKSFNAEQHFDYQLKNRCEVFAAWQYESFVGNGRTQPKYYLVVSDDGTEKVASKVILEYKSLNQILLNRDGEEQVILKSVNNMKLLAEMLITYLWLAASDFKLDHIGVDANNNLICLDFGESLIPFRFKDSVYTSRGWDFTLTPEDVIEAPFLTTYKSSNYFLERAHKTYPNVFDFLKDNQQLKDALCIAILKRCIFPSFISYQSLELFRGFDECSSELSKFLDNRTENLSAAALQNEYFIHFLQNSADSAYQSIRTDLLEGNLAFSRYFRNDSDFKYIVAQDLLNNYIKFKIKLKLQQLKKLDVNAASILESLCLFCNKQYHRLTAANKTAFFKKGSIDKLTLFMYLLNKIATSDLQQLYHNQLLKPFVEYFIKEVAIVSHHKRYSKINRFFHHTESDSWAAFIKLFSAYDGEYASFIKEVISSKVARVIKILNSQKLVSGYNDYREAIHPEMPFRREKSACYMHHHAFCKSSKL